MAARLAQVPCRYQRLSQVRLICRAIGKAAILPIAKVSKIRDRIPSLDDDLGYFRQYW